MSNKLVWAIFGLVFVIALYFVLFRLQLNTAGDIAEYYGITESLLRHGSIELQMEDRLALEKVMHAAKFTDPQYYINGLDGERYPVHFIFYSLLVLPIRVILSVFGSNPLLSLPVTNLLIFFGVLLYIMKTFLPSPRQKLVFFALAFASPLLFFITWPGPDLFYLSFLLLGIFFFFHKKYNAAAFTVTLASWHSQPIAVLAIMAVAYNFIHHTYLKHGKRIKLDLMDFFVAASLGFMLFIPYLYNLMVFGAFTPWVLFENGWTQLNGFGTQNISVRKLFEQFFDVNMGILWFAPLLTVLGIFAAIYSYKHSKILFFVLLAFIITAFFYQTNPAWHYGTAGYGPSRHIIFILPFFIFATLQIPQFVKKYVVLLLFLAVWQFYSLSFNGFLFPDFDKALYNTPYAEYILNNYPQLYNPTPEIFVDRTDHLDLDHPDGSIYKYNEVCKKAYVLPFEVEALRHDCGYIPEDYIDTVDSLDPDYPYEGVYVNY